jgi:hypothetical protein
MKKIIVLVFFTFTPTICNCSCQVYFEGADLSTLKVDNLSDNDIAKLKAATN